MTFEEAKEIFINRGYEQIDGGSIYNPDKWRNSIVVISNWLQQAPVDAVSRTQVKERMIKYGFLAPDMTVTEFVEDLPSVQSKLAECEDAISREQIINTLKQGYFDSNLQSARNDPCVIDAMIDWSIRHIKDSPSIQPKQTECEDAISRTVVLEIIRDFGYKNEHEEMLINERIKALPSVTLQPKQKTGHWKKMVSIYDVVSGTYTRVTYTDEDKKMGNMPIYECECGRTMPMPTNYCPDCGAKMERE